ncbi:MAG: G8 domain-containing protein [Verrucomicrobiae bacterium]|nr:G8 domain-containing protein [Verrucomicrobiae bacterium]
MRSPDCPASFGFSPFRQVLALACWMGVVVNPAIALDSWSSAATWQGTLPEAGEVVTIPAGHSVLLDVNPPELGGLILEGQLIFDQRDLHLTSRWILIDGGTLSIGSPDVLHAAEAIITLTGTDEDENIVGDGLRRMGTKFIGVMNGGSLELHGTRAFSRNWTQLAAHALAGATSIQVAEAIEWKEGDRLVIAPSGFDPNEAEEVTVTAVTDGIIHFEPPLRYDHWGELQVIGGHTIDERAEVACLTRNIVIQGDELSIQSNFGGHLMFGPGTTVHVEGVELRRMGQKGHQGRYPIHWHQAGDRPGDYARGNSIHHSYHRAIVTHGSSYVLIENNVSYDVWSHAFVPSEDGSERENRYLRNLGILTRTLALGDYAFPQSVGGASSQSEGRPGTFWLKSPDQILTGNHAAGVVGGMGFFFDGPSHDADWAGEFSNNTAHSCFAPSGSLADRYPTLTAGYGLFIENHTTPSQIEFSNFTAYKNSLSGMWLEAPGQRVRGATLVDNGTGAILFQSTLEDSVIVGQSDNTIGSLPPVGTSLSGGVHLVSGDDLKSPQLRNIAFVNQRDAGIVMLGGRLHPRSTLRNLRFTNTAPCWIAEPRQLTGGFTDHDGSLVGDGIPVFIHGNDALTKTAESAFDPTLNAWVTPLSSLNYLNVSVPGSTESDLGFTVLMSGSQTEVLPETGRSGAVPSLSGYVKKCDVYTMYRFDPLPDGVRVSLEGGESCFLYLDVPYLETSYVYEETTSGFGLPVPDFSRPVANGWEGSSTQDLRLRLQANQPVYVFDQPRGGLDLSSAEALWRSRQFGPEMVQDPASESLWGPYADPDGDGIDNRVEFFLATNPLHPDAPLRVHPTERRLSFRRNPEASDLRLGVFYSSDLRTWHSDVELRETLLPDGTLSVTATAPDLPSNEALFMVLRVESTP